jgi:hypothetical protein
LAAKKKVAAAAAAPNAESMYGQADLDGNQYLLLQENFDQKKESEDAANAKGKSQKGLLNCTGPSNFTNLLNFTNI